MPGPFDRMVCLVGENPLPIYLGIKQLATSDAKIVLVYSEATKPQAGNIKTLVEKDGAAQGNRGRTCLMNQVVQLRDPFSPRQVRETLDAVVASLPDRQAYALNYTGGTKVMSDYGLLSWILMQQAPQHPERDLGLSWHAVQNAFYLEEPSGTFHFHDDAVPLRVALTLDELLDLHGVRRRSLERVRPDISPADIEKMLGWYCDADQSNTFEHIQNAVKWTELHDRRANQQYAWFSSQYNQACKQWQNNCAWQQLLSLLTDETAQHWFDDPAMPASSGGYQGSLLEARFRFIVHGLWFELWVEDSLKKLLGSEQKIVTGAEFTIDRQRFESDVLTVVDHRLFYFSVTTADREGMCKAKMFEAMHRARQIGGGLAYSCVVSLAAGDEKYDPVQNCRRSVGQAPRHTLFGKAHVRQWRRGSYDSLRRFLEGRHRLEDRP